MPETQNVDNHTRRTPAYYNFAGLVLLVNILWNGYRLFVEFNAGSLIGFLLGVALLLGAFAARTQTLTVQNRVIRLEERIRYKELLPSDLLARTTDLTLPQVIALRFASDAELPGLIREVLDKKLVDPKAIKQQVKNWRADFLRA